MDHELVLMAYRTLLYSHDSWDALRYAFLLDDLSLENNYG